MSFPISPIEGEIYNNHVYNNGVWDEFDPVQDWAYKSGPKAIVTDYENSWYNTGGNGSSLDFSSSESKITVKEAGLYEIYACQRGSSTVSDLEQGYIDIRINGANYVTSSDVMSDFSDTRKYHHISEANFIGNLNANDIITAGPPSTFVSRMIYGNAEHYGSLIVRRLD